MLNNVVIVVNLNTNTGDQCLHISRECLRNKRYYELDVLSPKVKKMSKKDDQLLNLIAENLMPALPKAFINPSKSIVYLSKEHKIQHFRIPTQCAMSNWRLIMNIEKDPRIRKNRIMMTLSFSNSCPDI